MVRSLGADHVVDYSQNDFARGGTQYDLILDNVGNRKLSDFRKIMVPGGRCALAGVGKHLPTILKHLADALVRRFFLRQKFIFFIAKIRKDDLAKLADLMTTGNRAPVIDKSYSLSDSATAIDYVETGHARAKVVIVP